MLSEAGAGIVMVGVAAVTFSVSGVEYQNVVPFYSMTNDLITTFKMVTGGSGKREGVQFYFILFLQRDWIGNLGRYIFLLSEPKSDVTLNILFCHTLQS